MPFTFECYIEIQRNKGNYNDKKSITFKKTHSGPVKAMAKVSCHLEKSKKEALTLQLDCRNHRRHCAAINPKLDWVHLQAAGYNGLQVGVGLQVVGVLQVESLPGTEQGRAGEKTNPQEFPCGSPQCPNTEAKYTSLPCSREPSDRSRLPVLTGQTTALPGLCPSPPPMVRTHMSCRWGEGKIGQGIWFSSIGGRRGSQTQTSVDEASIVGQQLAQRFYLEF